MHDGSTPPHTPWNRPGEAIFAAQRIARNPQKPRLQRTLSENEHVKSIHTHTEGLYKHASLLVDHGGQITEADLPPISGSVSEIDSHANALAAQLAEAEARAARWKAHAIAWERYDHAYMLLTEAEIDEAHRVLAATENQLREHGDLPDVGETAR